MWWVQRFGYGSEAASMRGDSFLYRRPKVYITISFGLRYRKESPRIDAASEPYPNRWTHHMLISSANEIDDELMEWVKEAAVFSAGKR